MKSARKMSKPEKPKRGRPKSESPEPPECDPVACEEFEEVVRQTRGTAQRESETDDGRIEPEIQTGASAIITGCGFWCIIPLTKGRERGRRIAQSGEISHCLEANPSTLFSSRVKRDRTSARAMTSPHDRLAVWPPTLHG